MGYFPSKDRTGVLLLHRPSLPVPPMWSLSPSPPAFHVSHLRSHILADNLPAEIHKRLVDICPPSRARFVVGCVAPALADRECARTRHRPVFFQVRLVAHNDEGNARIIFYADNLVAEFVQFGQGGEGGDGEDEKETLAGFHVEFPVPDALVLRRSLHWRAVCVEIVAVGDSNEERMEVTSWRLGGTGLTWLHWCKKIEDRAVHLLNCSVPAVSNLIAHQRYLTSEGAFLHTFLIYTDVPTGGQHAHEPMAENTHIYFNLLPV